jgi:polysaccharide pyruvyl transferase WcaK-like protein
LIKLDTIFNFGHFNKWAFRTLQFKQKYFKQTKVYFDNDELKELNSKFDIFVCGSDQIWAPSVFDKAYFLEFVNSKYKFSYAASLGLNMIPNELKKEYHDLLLDFDSVSVREKKGQDLLKELGVNSTVVLDPTFLLNKN